MFNFLKLNREKNKKNEIEESKESLFLKEKFKSFQKLLDFNDEILKLMSEFSERLSSNEPISIGYGERKCYEILDKTRDVVTQLRILRSGFSTKLMKKIDEIEEDFKVILAPNFYCPDRLACQDQNCKTCEKSEDYKQNIPYSLDLNEIATSNMIGVGKKMSRLGELKKVLNINIPEAFILTSRCFDEFCNTGDMRKQISQNIKSINFRDMEDVQKGSQNLQALILNTPIPAEMENEILTSYDTFVGNNPNSRLLAVRSSAIGEDSPEYSFAGLHHTALNVSRENLIDACMEVLLSKYDPQSLVYRYVNGLRDKDMPMSIGCMAMIDSVVSGVMFTNDPLGKRDGMIIQAARGVGVLVVDGRITPQEYIVEREEPYKVISFTAGRQGKMLSARETDGLAETPVSMEVSQNPYLTYEQIFELAKLGMLIEDYFESTQDIEWAIDKEGKIFILQARPLNVAKKSFYEDYKNILAPKKVLLQGGDIACQGIATGEVFVANRLQDLYNFPEGGILVTTHATASFTRILHKASAVVADIGSTTGHFALIARELKIPTLLNVSDATSLLSTGMKIIVDALEGKLYEGESPEIDKLIKAQSKIFLFENSPVFKVLEKLSHLILPLNLTDPTSPTFRPEGCETLHDITRFAHEIAIKEMFNFFETDKVNRRMVRRLIFQVPLNLFVIDLGGGLEPHTKSSIYPEEVLSEPFKALIEGMTAPGVKWAGPVPVDFKGLTHLVMASVVDSTRSEGEIGSNSYAFITDVYVNFSSRLGYHFTRLDAYSSDELNSNYITFSFKGGAADTLRRTRRAKFIARVLEDLGFTVLQKEDLVHASIRKIDKQAMNERLVVLGRLMGAVRNIDVTMVSDSVIEKFAKEFLSGNNTPAIEKQEAIN